VLRVILTSLMEAEPVVIVDEHAKSAHDKFFMENTLLRIAGALFCHDAKRAPTRTQQIELNTGVIEKNIVVRPDPRLGQPGPLAHKIFVALIKKHSDYGRRVQNEISFTRREIGRLIGRKDWGGRDSEQLSRALHEIHYTFVSTSFKKIDGHFVEHSFNIFPQIWIERREFASDPIESCTITLADPIVASLQDEHFTCLNHTLMTNLGTIGQALYMRLFFHLANLYDGANRQRLVFQKLYDDICAEWLGGLTVLGHRSKIMGEQLGKHLDQLVQTGFLSSYVIGDARTRGREGFTITFRPGPTFYADYDRFYRRQKLGRVQWDDSPNDKGISDPLKVAYLFAENLTGQAANNPSVFVPSKDVETAKQLLTALGFDDIPAFLDFALAEAKKTTFDIRTLGGTKQYIPAYLAFRQRRVDEMVREAARRESEHQEAKLQAYDRFRRAQATDMFASLSESEQHTIETLARTQTAKFTGAIRDVMFDFAKVRITIERHGDQLKTFGEWRSDTVHHA
jgi:hypothetical protein